MIDPIHSQRPARLILHGVSLRLGELTLADLFLELPAGEVGVVFGRRASGKTTLLDLAARVRLPDSGEVLLDGRDLAALAEREPEQFWSGMVVRAGRSSGAALGASILDYVALPLVAARRLDRKKAEQRARAALERLSVLECAALQWPQLSAVQRAHAKLAQALAREPSLILVDDLIDGLPLVAAREMVSCLRDLACELDLGVLVTTSELQLGARADRFWELDGHLCPYGHHDTTTPALL
jgi:ABC-type cobalamin/Fe3+-siderophores transport system ATPase subunit